MSVDARAFLVCSFLLYGVSGRSICSRLARFWSDGCFLFLLLCLPHCLVAEMTIQWSQVVATFLQLPTLKCDTLANAPRVQLVF